jgi:hypothetical protein
MAGLKEFHGIQQYSRDEWALAGSLGLAFGPPQQLSTAIRTDVLHLSGAALAEGTFIGADHRHLVRRQRLMTFLTFSFHLQGH